VSSAIIYALLAITVAIMRNSTQRIIDRNIFAVLAFFWMLMAIVALH
jgi:hypothetical protein